MQVFYAPFRTLETQFVSYAASLHAGPGRRVLVLCPSGRVAARLRRLLAEKTGLVSNVFFVTFSQLIARLDGQCLSSSAPLLPMDALHDYILKNLLLKAGLNLYKPSRGFTRALRASLQDLADCMAEPEVLEEHLQTTSDPLLQGQKEHLQWLIKIYRAYLQKIDGVEGYRCYNRYFQNALAEAQDSPWLKGFAEILVYGFYELTGRQLELFHMICKHYPLAAFWPYASHPAFAFGRKFFETNVIGAAETTSEMAENWDRLAAGNVLKNLFTSQTSSSGGMRHGVGLVSAPDPQGEVFFVVKEMLRLHEQEHVAYADMALSARSLEPYKTLLPTVFAQNGIPLKTTLHFGFSSRPLGVFLMNLFALARGGFDKKDVLAVVTSPYFKKKNDWRYLIEQCLAQRDFTQWTDLVLPTLPSYDPEFLSWLENVKHRLEFLERSQDWNVLWRAAQEFVKDNVNVQGLKADEQSVWNAFCAILDGFVRYRAVKPFAAEKEFLDELFASFQDVVLTQNISMESGVTAADAQTLRGQAFKVVFVLGLNEKTFPQSVYEDPILKDYYRRVLRDQLGFWINQKMERFDEERLLFFCLLEAAEEKLYLSFLRADADGKPLIPSCYLVEFARAAGLELDSAKVRRISGRLPERLKETDIKRLSKKEMSLLLAAENAEENQYQAAGLYDEALADVLAAAKQIASAGVLTERDGVVRGGEDIFAAQNTEGFSPSALQHLAQCPMRYFMDKAIGLKEPEEALSRDGLAPALRGRMYHQILMRYYKQLYQEKQNAADLFPSALKERLEAAIAHFYHAASYKQFGIYPVVWQLILQNISETLSDFVVKDAENLEGFVPAVFETRFKKDYALSPSLNIRFMGIVDRIDVNEQNRTFRVVDYKKSRLGGKNLALDMFAKVILQPFVYLSLAQDSPQTRGFKADGAALLIVDAGYFRQTLSAQDYEDSMPRAKEFFTCLMRLIKDGKFFVNPSKHCQFCPYASICRKDAYRTLLRAKHAPQARQLQEVKQ